MTPGLAIASGYNSGDEPAGAFDGDSVTAWVANCDVSCNQTRRSGIILHLFLFEGLIEVLMHSFFF